LSYIYASSTIAVISAEFVQIKAADGH